MIDHRKGNQIDVHASVSGSDTFSIDENQSFFRQQTPQVRYDRAIAETDTVLGASRAHLQR